jgi:hypothetical protein
VFKKTTQTTKYLTVGMLYFLALKTYINEENNFGKTENQSADVKKQLTKELKRILIKEYNLLNNS